MMNAGHHGPWLKVGVPGNMLERFRHTASERLRPEPTRSRFEDPPTGGFMSAVSTSVRPRTMTRTRTGKRRRYSRKRRGRRNRRIPRALVPATKIVRLKVVDVGIRDYSASSNLQGYAYSIMNVYDPLAGHGTAQPLGFDQLAALYKRGVVLGLRVTLRIHNQSNVSMLVGITPMKENMGSTLLTEHEHYMEAAGTRSLLLSPEMDVRVLTASVSTRRHFAVSKLKDAEDLHFLLSGTGPTRDAYVHLWAQPTNTGVTPTEGTDKVEFVTTLEYLVLLSDPIIPSRST